MRDQPRAPASLVRLQRLLRSDVRFRDVRRPRVCCHLEQHDSADSRIKDGSPV